ncbi:MAG: DUF4388 domain-containing protein [Polyangiales bacterium]
MARSLSIPPGQPGPIILVDDESELVLAVSAMLRAEFGESRVRSTSDATQALGWIKDEKPSVLITDVRMPGLSGLDLIAQAQKTWGPTPTVVITAFPTEAVSVGARRGSFVYLPKPFSFRSLVETVQQLEAAPPASFSGAIAVSTLADLLQLYAISGSTGMMSLRSSDRRGEIWFEKGQVTHARTDEAEGFEAFCAVLAWPKGSFSWLTRRTDKQTISMSVSELLLEAYRIHDESNHARRASARPPPSAEPELDFNLDTLRSLPPPSLAPQAAHDTLPPPPAAAEPELPPARVEVLPPASVEGLLKPEHFRIEAPESTGQVLHALTDLDGFLGAALVDSDRRATLGAMGRGFDVEAASVGNTDLVAVKRRTIRQLDLEDEIEDILITLGRQYHLIRPLRARPGLFFYMALDRERANLAMARMRLADAERGIVG